MPVNGNGTDDRQLPTEEVVQAARALARRLIYRMVAGGAPISEIKKSHTGIGGPGYSVQVGGWMDGKSYATDYIIVRAVEGREVNLAFKTRDIYRDIEAELKTALSACGHAQAGAALEDFKLEPG
ncbi:MAG: hypothetical protein AB1742_02460 [bacterium]